MSHDFAFFWKLSFSNTSRETSLLETRVSLNLRIDRKGKNTELEYQEMDSGQGKKAWFIFFENWVSAKFLHKWVYSPHLYSQPFCLSRLHNPIPPLNPHTYLIELGEDRVRLTNNSWKFVFEAETGSFCWALVRGRDAKLGLGQDCAQSLTGLQSSQIKISKICLIQKAFKLDRSYLEI